MAIVALIIAVLALIIATNAWGCANPPQSLDEYPNLRDEETDILYGEGYDRP